jgi:uncharacterized phage protein (TIGR02220 family)
MSKLLVNENPLMIIPSLAVKIGLNEAVILQQVHYWLVSSKHVNEERKWINNTYKDWQKLVPFWSESTVKRTIKSLKDLGVLLTGNWNESKLDKTKWYSIDYEKLEQFEIGSVMMTEQAVSEIEEAVVEMERPISEITLKKNDIPYSEIIEYLNAITHSSYRPGTKKTKELIEARWQEGFTFSDFQKVIDIKTSEWLHDPEWSKFLRPITLFGGKFESYLNQKERVIN